MSQFLNRILIAAMIFMTLSSAAFAQTDRDEEARKHLVRGMAAIEMAKSEAELASAAMEFEKATEISPTMAAAWYNLGSIQVKIGQIDKAIESYKKYLSLAPKAEDARRVKDEIFKLEYRQERDKLSAMLIGAWINDASSEQTFGFKLTMEGSRIQLTQTKQYDHLITIKALGSSSSGPMTDAPPLVFSGTLLGNKISGQYLQPAGKSSGYCDIPEIKGPFEGTVDIAAGQMRIVYDRVQFEYLMQFKSFLSDELICSQTNRYVTPGYVLKLKRSSSTTPTP